MDIDKEENRWWEEGNEKAQAKLNATFQRWQNEAEEVESLAKMGVPVTISLHDLKMLIHELEHVIEDLPKDEYPELFDLDDRMNQIFWKAINETEQKLKEKA